MREIKAYIRCSKVDNVLSKLEAIGIQNITVIDVMAMGRGMVDKNTINIPSIASIAIPPWLNWKWSAATAMPMRLLIP